MNQSTAAEMCFLMQSATPQMERMLRAYAETALGITDRVVRMMMLDISAEESKREIRSMAAAAMESIGTASA